MRRSPTPGPLSGLVLSAFLVACSGSTAGTGDPIDPIDPANDDSGTPTKDSSTGTPDDGGAVDEDTGSSDDTGTSDDSGIGDDTAGTTDASDTSGPPPDVATGPVLRFVALGDTGEGNAGQKKVGDAIAAKCAKDGCDFVQLLGDNIYDSGVSGTSDPQWTTKFETPYGAVSLPFYAVLGNHDYGGGGAGTEFGKGQHQVDYTSKSTKWKMPAKYYQRTEKGVSLFGLDTNMMMFSMAGDQKKDVQGWIGASTATWKIAFGHHPYYSNGPHGDAGRYEGVPYVPVVSGGAVKDFFDDAICGKVDVYICGHDHSRQWLKDKCKTTELIISGGGAKTTELKGSHPYWFQENTIGFVYVVVEGNKLTAEFVDENGATEYTRTITK